MNRCLKTGLAIVGLWILCAGLARATIKPHPMFSDGAVLQQGINLPVWGTAGDGEQVTVEFQGQKVQTVAKGGQWLVKLKPLKPGGPFTLTLSGVNTVTVTNLLVGEVWICSGQSNMEFPLAGASTASNAIANATDPLLRLLTVPRNPQDEAQRQHTQPMIWKESSPATAADFSAVGYFFGRDLRKACQVPVGLIHSSFGGTPAEPWTSKQGFEEDPELRLILQAYEQSLQKYPQQLADYQKQEPELLAKYAAAVEQAKQDHKPAPQKPAPPANPGLSIAERPACLYNGMIAPLVPFGIRGVIWYQGESNVKKASQYPKLFGMLIRQWRKHWGEGQFPFLFVQIAPKLGMPAEIREAHLLTSQQVPNTAMVVITDYGDAYNIHPPRKEPVGDRLALAARALAYKEKIEYAGPTYRSCKVDGDHLVLSFTHVGGGLVARDGDLKDFMVAGADKKFVPAQAKIQGAKVFISSPAVPHPLAVRYGWSDVPSGNLYNKEELPASPFRSE